MRPELLTLQISTEWTLKEQILLLRVVQDTISQSKNDGLACPGDVVPSNQSSARASSFNRLKSLAENSGYFIGRSDSDRMRVAVATPYEFISGLVLPQSVYPNVMQAYRAIKYQLGACRD